MKLWPLMLFGVLSFSLHAEEFEVLVAKGEALDAQLKTQAALSFFLEAEKLQPNGAPLLSRIAKQYGESMTDTGDVDEKIRRGNIALDYAKRAVAADPDYPMAQLALAVSYGRLALLLDNKTKIAYSRLVKQHADIAARLAPENDLCWHVLGVWTHGMANLNPIMKSIAGVIYGKLPPASNQEAIQYFEKAIAINPNRVGNYVELGKTLIAMNRKTEARAELEKALQMPSRQRDDAESKRVAKALLQKL